MGKTKFGQMRMTPLLVVGAFISLTEVVVGIAAAKTTGNVQNWLIGFVCVFPVLIAVAFFLTLWTKPFVFYPPGDFGSAQDVGKYVDAMRGASKRGEYAAASLPEKRESQVEAAKPPAETSAAQPALQSSEIKASIHEVKKVSKSAEDWRMDMAMAFVDGKKDEWERCYEELKSVEKDAKKRKEHGVFYHYLRVVFAQDTESFAELKKFTSDPEVRSLAFVYIGEAYESSKDYEKAARAYESSIVDASQKTLAGRLVSLADCYASDGKATLALDTLTSRLNGFTETEDLVKIYVGIAGVYQSLENQEMRAIALEKAVELKPNDTDLRFKVAWAYSSHGRKKLALLHYSTLKTFKSDDPDMLNNLGVELERLNLLLRAVRNYKESFDLKNTLAGANLAYQYMNAGFYAEADEVLDKAKTHTDVHPNVGSAIAALSKLEEDEEKKFKELTRQGLEEQKFLKLFAEAYFVKEASSVGFAGQWLSDKGQQLALNLSGAEIHSKWIQDEKKNEFSGVVSNRGARIKNKTFSEKDYLVSVLGTKETSGYAFVSKDGQTMRWLVIDGDELSFIDFKKQA